MQKNLISVSDFSEEELKNLFAIALNKENLFDMYENIAKGKILTTLFFQPSTRTVLSFKSAFLRLGGNYIGFSDIENTRYGEMNRESFNDTLYQLSQYCDMIVVRSKDKNFFELTSHTNNVPIISAGLGNVEHPTSGMGEALSILDFFGKLDGLKILIIGKLPKRCVHSFLICLSNWNNVEVVIMTPRGIKLGTDFAEKSKGLKSIKYVESFKELEDNFNIKDFDAIFVDDKDSERQTDTSREFYWDMTLNMDNLRKFRKDVYLTVSLPRSKMVPKEIDSFPNSMYFKKSTYSYHIRTAIIAKMLSH